VEELRLAIVAVAVATLGCGAGNSGLRRGFLETSAYLCGASTAAALTFDQAIEPGSPAARPWEDGTLYVGALACGVAGSLVVWEAVELAESVEPPRVASPDVGGAVGR
jgi:hypothetical protein